MKVYIIIGLPCSGKTYLANQISSGIIPICDDSICIGRDIFSKCSLDELRNGYILSHPFLCVKETLQSEINWINETFKNMNISIECIYFENNFNKCLKNLEYRIKSGDSRNVELSIRRLAKEYSIPGDYLVLPIWQSYK